MLDLKIALTAAALAALPLPNARAEESLRPLGAIAVAQTVDGDTLALADGRTLRLAGIIAPKGGDPGRAPEIQAIAAAAKTELARLVIGAKLDAFADALAEDRHGRTVAHLRSADGTWIQDEILRRGLARVLTQPGVTARARTLLGAEASARAAGRGLWSLPDYAVRRDRDAARHADSFQFVAGRVWRTAATRDRLYLNFGRDWRRDFTIGIDRPALAAFRRAGLDPELLSGKRVRVRGWVIWRNGPYLGATHPEQIEVLE